MTSDLFHIYIKVYPYFHHRSLSYGLCYCGMHIFNGNFLSMMKWVLEGGPGIVERNVVASKKSVVMEKAIHTQQL